MVGVPSTSILSRSAYPVTQCVRVEQKPQGQRLEAYRPGHARIHLEGSIAKVDSLVKTPLSQPRRSGVLSIFGTSIYNAHKGKGYEVQIAEICAEDNNEGHGDQAHDANVITHVAVTDACASDGHATMPTLKALNERGHRPEELVADTTFGSGANAVDAGAWAPSGSAR